MLKSFHRPCVTLIIKTNVNEVAFLTLLEVSICAPAFKRASTRFGYPRYEALSRGVHPLCKMSVVVLMMQQKVPSTEYVHIAMTIDLISALFPSVPTTYLFPFQ